MGTGNAAKAQFETLTAALFAGQFEAPLWHNFLELLRRAAGADYAILIVQPPQCTQDQGLHLMAGPASGGEIAEMHRRYFYPENPVRREWVTDGQAYALEDLKHFDGGLHPAFFADLEDTQGIAGILEMRVEESGGTDAWLTVARRVGAFDPAAKQLMEALAPILRGVLHSFLALERERFASSVSSEATRRIKLGWLALDSSGEILASDPYAERLLGSSGAMGRDGSNRLALHPAGLDREMSRAIEAMAGHADAQPRAFTLKREPRLDILLIPARDKSPGPGVRPAVIAYIQGDNWQNDDRCAQIVDLFGITSSEARLALALCRGRSLTEAAAELGLTTETARSYSKAIYAKTGTRGLADLVRTIMGSVIALAPAS